MAGLRPRLSSDLKQWLDSEAEAMGEPETALSPYHDTVDDFSPKSLSDAPSRPSVDSPSYKEEHYLWHEDGKDDYPQMDRLAAFDPSLWEKQEQPEDQHELKERPVCPECGRRSMQSDTGDRRRCFNCGWMGKAADMVPTLRDLDGDRAQDIEYQKQKRDNELSTGRIGAVGEALPETEGQEEGESEDEDAYEKSKRMWYEGIWSEVTPASSEDAAERE